MKNIFGKTARGCIVAIIMIIINMGNINAAAEWEWVNGQGWTMGAGVARPTPEEQLAYAYELEQKSEFLDAAKQYFLLIRHYPETKEAGIGLQRLAKCLFEMENYYTSFQAIEQVIKTYPKAGRVSELVGIELEIAKKLLTTKAESILETKDKAQTIRLQQAIEVAKTVIEHDPYGPTAPEAYLIKGEASLILGKLKEAREAFETIREDFPRSDYVARARLGILRCDSLIGQATPQEVQEQIEVVREYEAKKNKQKGIEEPENAIDEVEIAIAQQEEVEAAKMISHAEQYKKMGSRDTAKAAEFVYKEVIRRFPKTEQANIARERLGKIVIPKKDGGIASAIKNIKINPFKKDNELPPWITPKLPDDEIVINEINGPILGVPETGIPAGQGVGIRPAALDEFANREIDYEKNSQGEFTRVISDYDENNQQVATSLQPLESIAQKNNNYNRNIQGIQKNEFNPEIIDLAPTNPIKDSSAALANPSDEIPVSDLVTLEENNNIKTEYNYYNNSNNSNNYNAYNNYSNQNNYTYNDYNNNIQSDIVDIIPEENVKNTYNNKNTWSFNEDFYQ